jgi:hypothetical protein
MTKLEFNVPQNKQELQTYRKNGLAKIKVLKKVLP